MKTINYTVYRTDAGYDLRQLSGLSATEKDTVSIAKPDRADLETWLNNREIVGDTPKGILDELDFCGSSKFTVRYDDCGADSSI